MRININDVKNSNIALGDVTITGGNESQMAELKNEVRMLRGLLETMAIPG